MCTLLYELRNKTMTELPMCRICLSKDVQLHSLSNTHLQEMYEILTTKPFQTKDGRPTHACYSCYKNLDSSYSLRKQCLESEEILILMISDNTYMNIHKVNHEKIKIEPEDYEETGVSGGNTSSLEYNVLPLNSQLELSFEIIKEEQEDHVDTPIKTEPVLLEENGTVENIQPGQGDLTSIALQHSNIETNTLVPGKSSRASQKRKAATSPPDVTEQEVKIKSKNNMNTNEPSNNNITCDVTLENVESVLHGHFICDICKKNVKRKSDLVRHIRVHTRERPFQCKVCKKRFIQSAVLAKHGLIHTSDKPYQCKACNKCFSQITELDAHMRIHTINRVRRHQCDACFRSFLRNSDLVKHSRTHTGEKPYECKVCKKNFRQRCHLNRHVRTMHMP